MQKLKHMQFASWMRTNQVVYRSIFSSFLKKAETSDVKLPSQGRYIFAFGQGENGRLGLNNQENVIVPRPLTFQPPSKITQLAAGGGHSLALTEQGALYAWGANSSGQLGLGDTDSALAPLRIKALSNKKVIYVSAGDKHSAAVTEDGELYTWGSGGHIVKGIGGLGHGNKTNVTSPKLVEALKGVKIVQVACGGYHSAALSDKGEIFTWGKGDYGRLGHGDSFNQPLPKQLVFFNLEEQTPKKLALGRNYSAVLTEQGEIYMFGKNEHFQLGFESAGNLLAGGNFDGEKIPTLLKFFGLAKLNVKDISCGDFFSACVTENGEAWAWGKGIYEPTKIKIPAHCERVSCGRNHIAYVTRDGDLYLFGSPMNGQLGTSGSILSSTQTLHKIPKEQIPGKIVLAVAGQHFTLCLADMGTVKE